LLFFSFSIFSYTHITTPIHMHRPILFFQLQLQLQSRPQTPDLSLFPEETRDRDLNSASSSFRYVHLSGVSIGEVHSGAGTWWFYVLPISRP
jgi:hypothetical protein